MDLSRPQSVAFLLSLGALPIACFVDNGSGGGTTGDDSGESTTTAGKTTLTTTTTTTTGTTSSTTTTTGTTTGTTTTTTGEPDLCDLYGAHWLACDPAQDDRDDECYYRLYYAADAGRMCVALQEAVVQCLLVTSCMDLLAGDACATEEAAAAQGCMETSPACQAYGPKAAECGKVDDEADGVAECQAQITYLAEYGAACGEAAEDYFACLAMLECADLEAGVGCEAIESTLQMVCG